MRRPAERVARRYIRRFYAGCDPVLAPSRVMLEHLGAAGVDRCRVQPLGVDPDAFHPRLAGLSFPTAVTGPLRAHR